MGAVISHHHVLTSKLCFGRMVGETFVFNPPLLKLKRIIKVMLGAVESFPYPYFPHSTALEVNHDGLREWTGIVLNDIEEFKHNPDDEFCILTMKDYVKFTGSIRALCLPQDPKKFYLRGDPNNVEILGYGYKSRDSFSFTDIAKTEKLNRRQMLLSRRRRLTQRPVISRLECSEKVNSNLKMYGNCINKYKYMIQLYLLYSILGVNTSALKSFQ